MKNSTAVYGDTSSASLLDPSDLAEWDQFVLKHPLGNLYHTSAWKVILEKSFKHIRGEVLVIRNTSTGPITGGLPLFNVQSWFFGSRLVSVPFATVSDPLLARPGDMKVLYPIMLELRKRSGSRRIESRVRRSEVPALECAGWRRSAVYKHHFLSLDEPLDTIYARFSKTAVRRMITKAQTLGVVVKRSDDGVFLPVFYQLYLQTRKRRALPPIPYHFFEVIYQFLKREDVFLLITVYNGKPVAGVIGLKYKDQMLLEYSGETPGSSRMGINPLMYWTAIRLSKEAGCRQFSFGRTSTMNEGLLNFKRHWRPVEEDIHIMLDLNGVPLAENGIETTFVYRLFRSLACRAPMPMLRMIGNFCYRHLG